MPSIYRKPYDLIYVVVSYVGFKPFPANYASVLEFMYL